MKLFMSVEGGEVGLGEKEQVESATIPDTRLGSGKGLRFYPTAS